MTTHKRPEVFPDHLEPETLPVPETKREAFELLLILWGHDPNRDANDGPTGDSGRHGRTSSPGPCLS